MTPNSPACPECGARLPAEAPLAPCPRCLLLRGFESAVEPSPTSTVHLVLPDDAVLATQPLREQFGNYELLAEIGRGGMGVIYQARQRTLDRIVAVKLIRSGTLARAEDIARFKVEAAATARLRHPGIVAIHEVGEHEGRHFYSMDFVPGRSLAEALRDGPFAPRRAAGCVRAVAEAIHYAHDSGVLHRDLKPSNILLDAEGEPHVTDFGLAKLLHHESELTLTGAVLGSPNYMPPEQARGQHAETSARSDVYSQGAILYECLTGRPPFTAATPLETMKLVVEQEPIAPRVLNPALPRDLETICLKCLAKESSARYASARELAGELGRFLNDEPIRARPAGFVERTARWCRRKPAQAALIGVSLAAVVAILAVTVLSNARVRREQVVTRQNLYAADLHLAALSLRDHDLALADQLLDEHRPKPGQSDLRGFEWRLAWSRGQGNERRILTGHTGAVQSVAFSPDGRRLFSGDEQGVVRVWDTATWQSVLSWKAAPDAIEWISVAPDGRTIATTGHSYLVKLWEAGEGRELWRFQGYRAASQIAVRAVCAPTGHQLAISWHDEAAAQRFVSVFDWTRGSAPALQANWHPYETHRVTNAHYTEAFLPDGRLALIQSNQFGAYDLERNQFDPLPGLNATHLVASPDGSHLAAYISGAPEVIIGHLDEVTKTSLSGHSAAVGSLAFSPDGKVLASGSDDQAIRFWAVEKRQSMGLLHTRKGTARSLVFSPDGQTLVSGGSDGAIRLWPARAPASESGIITNFLNPCVASESGRWLAGQATLPMANGSLDRFGLAICNLETARMIVVSNLNLRPVYFTSNDQALATLRNLSNDTVQMEFHDLATGAIETGRTFPWQSGVIWSANAVLDGRRLALTDERGTTTIWDTASGVRRAELRSSYCRFHNLSFSPRADRFYRSCFAEGKTWLEAWDLEPVRLAFSTPPEDRKIWSLKVSPDGRYLAGCSGTGGARLWDAKTGQEVESIGGQKFGVNGVAFSTDGRTLATEEHYGSIKLWNLATRREIGTVSPPGIFSRTSRHLEFTADGRALVAVDWGCWLRVWRVPDFAETDRVTAR